MARRFLLLTFVVMILGGCGGIEWFPDPDPNAPTSVTVTADPASPVVGATVTITATAKKADGTAVADNTLVSFSSSTGGTFDPSSATATTTNGTATIKFSSTKAGSFIVTASSGTALNTVTVTFKSTVTVSVNPPNIIITTLNGTATTAGTPVTVTATVTDSSGTPKPNITVNFSVTNANGAIGTLDSASAVTGSDGVATVKFTSATAAGTYTITATTPDGNTGTQTINVTSS